jgi:O-antigen ligase
MQDAKILQDKYAIPVGLAVLFFGVVGAAYTGNLVLAALPVMFLFILLLGANWKTAYWALLFCIPVSIDVSFFGDSLSTSLPDEPLMWSFLLLFPILLARQPNMLPQWWLRHPIVFIIAVQYIWLMVAVFFSKELMFSVKFLVAKTWFLVSFFILPLFVFTEKKDFRKAFILVLIPLLATILIIFARHAALGFAFYKIEAAIGDIYYNHVDYSSVVSMFFPFVVVALILTARGSNPIIRGVLLGIVIFMIPAIYLTYARAAVLAVVFAAVVFFAIKMRLANLMMPVFYIAVSVGLFVLIKDHKYMDLRPNYQRTFMHRDFDDHLLATLRGEDMSSMERIYRWIASIRMSQDEPVKGFGPNAFYYYYKPYAVSSFETYVSRNFEKSTTHNYYLYLLVEQGWPAMILYAILVMAVFAVAQRTYWRLKGRDKFYQYITLGAAMMFGAGWVNNFFSDLIETHKVGSLFYLSIAIIVIMDKKARDLERDDVKETTYI